MIHAAGVLSIFYFDHMTYQIWAMFETFKSVSKRIPGRTKQEVIQLKSPISLKLGLNVGVGE